MKGFIKFVNSLKGKKSSANLAKERLQIIISHERAKRLNSEPDYLPKLQNELIAVISKYVNIDPNDVNVTLDKQGDFSVLELNITLPDEEVLVEETAEL